MRYFIGLCPRFLCVLILIMFFTIQGLSQLMLCPETPHNQTVRASIGSSAKFVACVISSSSQGLYCKYKILYGIPKNESFRLLFAQLSDQKYQVELIIGDVQSEHFGTHIISVINITTHQDVLNVTLTLLEEDNTFIEQVLPIGVTVGATVILIASAIILKKAGNRCQRYTINKKMYSMRKLFQLQKRKQSHVTAPVENMDDNHYDTVNEVMTEPDDNANGTAIIDEGAIPRESVPREATLAIRYTTMLTKGSPSGDMFSPEMSIESDYITPVDVVKRSRRRKKKSKSLQRDSLNHRARKERHRKKPYRSMDYPSKADTDKDEEYHHYCNCKPFKKTQEPTLLSIKQLRSFNQYPLLDDYVGANSVSGIRVGGYNQDPMLDDYIVVDCVADERSVSGTTEADTQADKSSEYKCHKYVNLEQFWDSFKNVNQELEQKIINQQSNGRKREI